MNFIVKVIFGVFGVSLMTACTAITEEECRLGDWYQIGLEDGQAGKKSYAATYNKECSEYKVNVDPTLYNEGRSEGLKSFCTYENGVIQGGALNDYNHVCPATLAADFLDGYTPYFNLAKANKDLNDTESKVGNIKSQLADEAVSREDKTNLKSQLRSAQSRLERLQSEVRKQELAVELHKTRREIQSIQDVLDTGELSPARHTELMTRRDKLIEKRDFIEKLADTSNTILTIKDLAEMF